MVVLEPCKKTGLNRVAYGKEIYINTEQKIIRLKVTILWIDEAGVEWKREELPLVISANDVIDYKDTGEKDEEGNPVLMPINGYDWWYSQVVDGDTIGDVLKNVVDSYIAKVVK